jgi:hypothetical protein
MAQPYGMRQGAFPVPLLHGLGLEPHTSCVLRTFIDTRPTSLRWARYPQRSCHVLLYAFIYARPVIFDRRNLFKTISS